MKYQSKQQNLYKKIFLLQYIILDIPYIIHMYKIKKDQIHLINTKIIKLSKIITIKRKIKKIILNLNPKSTCNFVLLI